MPFYVIVDGTFEASFASEEKAIEFIEDERIECGPREFLVIDGTCFKYYPPTSKGTLKEIK